MTRDLEQGVSGRVVHLDVSSPESLGKRVRVLVLVCAGLAGAALLAGCGGGPSSSGGTTPSGPPLTKAEYQAKLHRIVATVRARYGTVSTSPTRISNADLAKAVQGLRVLADRLAQVSPPAEVAKLHVQYVAAMRSLADELPGLTRRMGRDPSAGLEVLLGSEPIQVLLRVSQDFSKKGYDLDLDGS